MNKKDKVVKKEKDQKVKKSEFSGEKTVAGKYYVPLTDIIETEKKSSRNDGHARCEERQHQCQAGR